MKREYNLKRELKDFVKYLKRRELKEGKYPLGHHLCDHLIWMLKDYYILMDAFMKTRDGKVYNRLFDECLKQKKKVGRRKDESRYLP